MAESTLSLTWDQIYAEVGDFIGATRTVPNSDSDTDSRIKAIINAGFRQAYYPPPLDPKEPSHRWSWLWQIGSLTTANGTSLYALPDNSGGILSELTYTGQQQIALVDELWVRGQLARDTAVGKPLYAAVRPKAGQEPTRYEILLYPTPDSIYALSYRHQIQPDAPSTTHYPLGGLQHAELFIESCLAIAEVKIKEGGTGLHQKRFMELLADAVRLDQKQEHKTAEAVWSPATARTDIALGYNEITREIALALGWPADKNTWNNFQLKRIDMIFQEGYRLFLYPPPLAEKDASHNWSFLRQLGTLATVNGTTTYALPANFGGILGDFTFAVGAVKNNIGICDELQIRSALAQDSTAAQPTSAAVRPITIADTSGTAYEAIFYPKPNNAYTLTYRYNVIPALLTFGDTPLGGAQHSQTLLEACLAIVEKHTKNGGTWHTDQFKALLAQSVRIDKQLTEVSMLSPWPTTGASTTLGMQYRDLLREAGRALGFPWDSAVYTAEQRNLADTVVQQGYRKFLFPPPLPGEKISYEWSFLKIEATLTVDSSTDTFALPSNFASMDGDLYWSSSQNGWTRVQVVGLSEIREMQQSMQTQTGLPSFAAVINAGGGASDSSFTVVLWPQPDGTYTFKYHYKRTVDPLSDSFPYPYGGAQHGETILQAVLAVAELRNMQFHGVPTSGRGRRPYVPKPQSDEFMAKLSSSIALDQRFKPAAIGYNRENSDLDRLWPASRGTSVIVNGVSY